MLERLLNGLSAKILIVDDVKENRLIVKLTLKKGGKYQFYEASNGKEGVDIAIKELPHIILMDAIMPVMDGFEAIKILRENPSTKRIPIIMISSLDNKDDKVKILQCGSSDFISKPFDSTELIIRVNSLLTLYIQFLVKKQELQESYTIINKLHVYDVAQQKAAKEKIEVGIVNDMNEKEAKILYIPHDILSGDYYSLYKRKDGSKFIYLIDGQGHGISPALTVFSISSTINSLIHEVKDLQELIDLLFPAIKNFLGEIEQLSYTMIMINPDAKSLSYASGGMYPFLIKTANHIKKIKVNNLPFMNFSTTPTIKTIDIEGWESLAVYSDGLVEYESHELIQMTPEFLIERPSLISDFLDTINSSKIEDDVTLLYLQRGE
ncbi:MAG: response regulator [Sulfurimonas sp.]|jgi:CheY-like chemotaxis protein